MSATAQEAFEKYYDQLDPYGPNRGTQQVFIDGFNAACAQLAALQEENEQLKDDLVSKMIAKEERIDALSERCADAEAEVCRLDRQVNALKTKAKARVAELEGLLRDIKQHDIDETAKRILDGGRKFNYSLPLNIRERIATALKEPANEGGRDAS